MNQKIGLVPLIIRSRLIVFTIISLIGLYFLWDPLYFFYSLFAYFIFSAVGHDIGLHRFYCHQSFTCKNKFIEYFLCFCSCLSGISDPISYAKRHTWHHKYTDTELDNLQPKRHPFLTWWGYGILKANSKIDLSIISINKEVAENKVYQYINKNYFILYYFTLLVCFLINHKLSFYMLVVGSTVAHHVASLSSVINHRYGYQNFKGKDDSTNNTIFNFLSFGLGLHNNHHALPYAYTTKIKPWEVDVSGWIIKHVLAKTVNEPKTSKMFSNH